VKQGLAELHSQAKSYFKTNMFTEATVENDDIISRIQRLEAAARESKEEGKPTTSHSDYQSLSNADAGGDNNFLFGLASGSR
jgi:hypothetical protein